jgi:hypothetical protein
MALDDKVKKAIQDRHDWIEDVVAGLLINGVKKDEIRIVHYQDCTIKVFVRGVQKYTWCLDWPPC